MVNSTNLRNRRNRLYQEQDGHCWYCDVPCWLPTPGQENLSKDRVELEHAMATVEHQHARQDRFMETVRQVMACRECNSEKGCWTSALDAVAWAENGGVRDGGRQQQWIDWLGGAGERPQRFGDDVHQA